MYETLDGVLLKTRNFPIPTKPQTIYLYLLKRLQANRDKISKHEDRERPETYIDDCYTKEAYLRSYDPILNPVKHPKVYAFGPGLTICAPTPHFPQLPNYPKQTEVFNVGRTQLAPTSYLWKGQTCVSLSSLQATAGHVSNSLGTGSVELHDDVTQVVKNKGSPPGK
ncbi:hypothetical protein ACH5RR_039835 [Cinchona calisaya]|uniref:Uncharacterized protein n=1 Tax=Cinchona calisaya TaxID=153742 RepID=A0ABD2XZF5_9GENT